MTDTFDSDDLFIDFGGHVAKICGTEVVLSPLEFKLLCHLVKHKGRVCTKSDLLNQVWRPRAVEVGSIARCVWGLRAKLEKLSSHQYIKTIHRVGYKFNGKPRDEQPGQLNSINLLQTYEGKSILKPLRSSK